MPRNLKNKTCLASACTFLAIATLVGGQLVFPIPREVYATNHSRLTSQDDACSGQAKTTDGVVYTFYGEDYIDYFPCTNGIIAFHAPYRQYTPIPFPQSSSPLVAPFWADVDLTTCNSLTGVGCSFYTHYTGDDAGVIDERIQNEFGYPSFQADGVIVQTWDQVGHWNRVTEDRNTFQAIVASNQQETFACFYYQTIEWISGDFSYAPAQCGFDAGDLENEVTIPGSGSEDVYDFCLLYTSPSPRDRG